MVERAYPAGPALGAAGRILPSPLQYYLQGGEALRVTVWCPLVGAIVEITGRAWASDDGVIRPFRETIVTTASAAVGQTVDYPLTRGALLNVRAGVTQAPFTGHPVFVRVQLLASAGGIAPVLGTLAQGYVTSAIDQAWPGSPIVGSLDGLGVLGDGGAALAFGPLRAIATVPIGSRWQVVLWSALLTTSAVAGTREMYIRVLSPPFTTQYVTPGIGGLGPGANWTISVLPGRGQQSFAPYAQTIEPWPADLQLQAQSTVQVEVAGEQAGDVLSLSPLLVRKWIDV